VGQCHRKWADPVSPHCMSLCHYHSYVPVHPFLCAQSLLLLQSTPAKHHPHSTSLSLTLPHSPSLYPTPPHSTSLSFPLPLRIPITPWALQASLQLNVAACHHRLAEYKEAVEWANKVSAAGDASSCGQCPPCASGPPSPSPVVFCVPLFRPSFAWCSLSCAGFWVALGWGFRF